MVDESGYCRPKQWAEPSAEGCRLCHELASAALQPLPICARCAFQIYDVIAVLYDGGPRPEPMPAVSPRMSREGHVYYVRRGDVIKIGHTVDLFRRMTTLRPDEVLAVEPGTREDETERHRQFAHLKLRQGKGSSEYFRDAPELREHIAAVIRDHGQPPRLPTLQGA